MPPAGTAIVSTGTDVPTVGATARLNSLTKRAAAALLLITALHNVPELFFILVAFVVAPLLTNVVVGVTGVDAVTVVDARVTAPILFVPAGIAASSATSAGAPAVLISVTTAAPVTAASAVMRARKKLVTSVWKIPCKPLVIAAK